MPVKYSVIIPTRNRSSYLRKTLSSLQVLKNQPEFEVIIVDNGSTDDTREQALSFIEENDTSNARYFLEPEPGLLAGRHRGAKESQGKVLCYLDDDVRLHESWPEGIVDSFKDPSIGVAGGPSYPCFESSPPNWLSYLWRDLPQGGKTCSFLSLIDLGNQIKKTSPLYVYGLNYSIRKEVLYKLGGFNPDAVPKQLQRYRGDGETGLSMKAEKDGIQALYNPKSAVDHIINKNRLTLQSAKQIFYRQGISDSFTALRAGSINNLGFRVQFRLVVQFLKESARSLINLFSKKGRLFNQLNKSYKQGYRFHQREAHNRPEVMNWILKDNYFDYQIP